MPRPREYTNSKLKATDGVVAARVRIVPKIGPTHGVQPTANANPNTKDSGKLALVRLGKNFFSTFSLLIFVDNIRKIPKLTIIIPPTWFNTSITSPTVLANMLLITTPNVENTTENPRTKNTEFNMMFVLLIVTVLLPLFWLRSLSVVPEMYARNAGIIGSMHGATNEANPANAATASVTSTMN